MNMAGLRAFHAVARAGGFTRAAEEVGLSQPTLSSQVRALETEHETSLFDRRGRGVALSPLGLRLFDMTTRLFAAEEEARALLDGARTLRLGHLRVAADSATHAMPVLARMRQLYPGVTFSISTDNSTNVLRELTEYRAEVGVTAKQVSDPRVTSIPIRRGRLLLFVPQAHPWAKAGRMRISQLAGADLVMREPGSVTREVFEAALSRADIRPGRVFEMQGREAVREAVLAGFGIGIVYDIEMPPDPAFRTIQVPDADLEVVEYATFLEERKHLPLVRAFVEIVKERRLA